MSRDRFSELLQDWEHARFAQCREELYSKYKDTDIDERRVEYTGEDKAVKNGWQERIASDGTRLIVPPDDSGIL